jgi:transposase InsO family protein
LFVTCCRHTKQAHIIPTHTTTSARGLAALFRDHVWKLHGLPETALSDRGPQFAAEFMRELNDILGIQTKLSTAYHPQTDGQTERVNLEIEQYLRMFVSHRQNNWPEWIACAEFVYNNKVHTSTKISPFFTNYGYHPRMGIEPRRAGRSEPAKDFAERMKSIHEEAQAALSKA